MSTIAGVTARHWETGGGPVLFAGDLTVDALCAGRAQQGARDNRDMSAAGPVPVPKPSDEKILGDLTRLLVERFGARCVVLFGSRARGDARPDSDFDVFVEMESTERPPERNARILAEIGLRPWSLDLLVYTPDEVARVRPIPGTLLSMIESEGRVLHDAA